MIKKAKKDCVVSIEALTLCAGDCSGCFLTPEMRSQNNLWDEEKFKKVGLFLNDFFTVAREEGFDEFGINFGQGDYLQLLPKQIDFLLDNATSWLDGIGSLFFTASCVTNKKRLAESVDCFYKKSLEKKIPLLFDVVLGSSKLRGSFSENYKHNLDYLVSKFGYMNPHINVGLDVVEKTPPSMLKEILLENQIGFMAVNFVPGKYSKMDSEDVRSVVEWLREFMYISLNEKYGVNYIGNLRRLMAAYLDDETDYSSFENDSFKNCRRNVFIDFYGNLCLVQEGFGDFPLTERNNVESIFNVFEYDGDINKALKKIDDYCIKFIREGYSYYMKGACSACEYAKVCLSCGGYAIQKGIGKNKSVECDYGLKNFFETLHHVEKDDNRNRGVFIIAQKDLEGSKIQKEIKKRKNINEFVLTRK